MNSFDHGSTGRELMRFGFPPLTRVVKRIAIANLVVFGVVVVLGFGRYQDVALDWFAADPARWRQWFPFVPLWQSVTYGFLHDPLGLGHIFFNLLTLYFFGGMVESAIGGRRFATHYFIALVVGALAHVVIMPLFGVHAPAIGASGACLAMVVAAAVREPNRVILFFFFPVPLKWIASAFVAANAFQVILQLQDRSRSGDAIYVHLAGALYGYLAARRGWLAWEPVSAFERKRTVREAERLLSDDARMDQLLARIKREGMGSLSNSDRDFLRRQSERGR